MRVRIKMNSYAIIGTGAIGGFFAAKLKKAGFDVHCLLNSDYAEVNEQGLKLVSTEGGFEVPVHSYQNLPAMPPCDVVLITLKTTANSILSDLSNLIKKDTIVVVLQNGIGIEDELAANIDPEIIVGGSCNIKVTKIAPGVIKHDGFNNVELAYYDETTRLRGKLDELVKDFNLAGINAKASSHLPTLRWLKLMQNIPFSGLPVVYNSSTQELVEHHYDEIISLTREIIHAAKQCGANIPDDYFEQRLQLFEVYKKMPVAIYSSMKVDFDNHRPLELHAIYENPIRIAKQHNTSMPLTEALFEKLKKMNQHNMRCMNNTDVESLIKFQQQNGILKTNLKRETYREYQKANRKLIN